MRLSYIIGVSSSGEKIFTAYRGGRFSEMGDIWYMIIVQDESLSYTHWFSVVARCVGFWCFTRQFNPVLYFLYVCETKISSHLSDKHLSLFTDSLSRDRRACVSLWNLKLREIVDRFFFLADHPRSSAHLARVLVDFRKEKQNNVCLLAKNNSTVTGALRTWERTEVEASRWCFKTEGITTAIPTPYKNINTQSGNPWTS